MQRDQNQISEMNVFPSRGDRIQGLTYRQWLIGQIAANTYSDDCEAAGVITWADQIIEAMASEK